MERHYKIQLRYLLFGFNSTEDRIELSPEVVIRRGTESELNELHERITLHGVSNQQYILDYNITSKTLGLPDEGFEFQDRLNSFFQIFADGNVKIAHFLKFTEVHGELKQIGLSSNTRVSTYIKKKLIFEEDENKELASNWKKLQKCSLNNKAFNIALKRFLLSGQRYGEDALIDIMIAFEAIYLGVTEKSELSFKLGLRCSSFLRDHYDRMELHEFMKKAYNLRSQIVHGANTKGNLISFKEKKLDIENVMFTLSQIMQLTLKKYISEKTEFNTKQLIAEIDSDVIRGV